MKLDLQLVENTAGKSAQVQLPLEEMKTLLRKLLEYEQQLKLNSDLEEAMKEVELMQKGVIPKQNARDFLNTL